MIFKKKNQDPLTEFSGSAHECHNIISVESDMQVCEHITSGLKT